MNALIYYVLPVAAMMLYFNRLRVDNLELETGTHLLHLKNKLLRARLDEKVDADTYRKLFEFLDGCSKNLHTLNIWYIVLRAIRPDSGEPRQHFDLQGFSQEEVAIMEKGGTVILTHVARKSLTVYGLYAVFSGIRRVSKVGSSLSRVEARLTRTIIQVEGYGVAAYRTTPNTLDGDS